MSRSALRTLVAAVAAGVILGAGVTVPASAAVSPDAPVVIDEVYGGGGNEGGAFRRDFVELRNASSDRVDLTGWSVQYASTRGGTWQVTALGAVALDAGESLLVGEAAGADATLPGFEPDVSGSITMSATGGKVALVRSTAPLTVASGGASLPEVVDYIGWGAATDFAGTAPAPGTTNPTSVARASGAPNTTDNGADFAVGTPTPQGMAGEPEPEPEPAEVPIADIQGTGDTSPLVGATVTTSGVVTASYPDGGRDGYVLQTPGSGGTAGAASDAVFVYARGASGEVALGDTVRVTGSVSEFRGLTEITVAPGAAERLPAAAPPVPVAAVWPTTDAERERLESMIFAPQGPYTVTNTYQTNQYGEVGLAQGTTPLRQPTDVARPGSPEAAAAEADNAARAVVLDDGASTNFLAAGNGALTPPYVSLVEPVVVGGAVTFDAPVVVTWRNDAWALDPLSRVVGDGTGRDEVSFASPRTAAPASVGGDLSVASFNVLNYFTTLGTDNASCRAFLDRDGEGLTVRDGCPQRGAWDGADLQRQQDKLVAAVNTLDADVVGLIEVENSAALGETPDEALATFTAALNAAAGATKWAYVPSSAELPDPATRDVITNAIIYQPAAVTPVGSPRALGTQSADDQAFGNAREPIAQVFRPAAGGERFVVVVNHFKSKGSAGPWPGDADAGDGQAASNESRVRQASALRDWVASIQGPVESVALVGDFNSYGAEDPLQVLYDAGYVDAEQALGLAESSYSFDGLSGSLDHILLNGPAFDRTTGADIWNINSGESVALEYSRYDVHGTLFYAPGPFRSSDHDPVIVGLAAGVDERPVSSTRLFALPPLQINRLLPATLVAAVTQTDRRPSAGTVEFREGSTVIGSAPVRQGVATLRLPRTLSTGVHEYTAVFVPSDSESVRSSTSNAVRVRVIG